LCRAFVAHLLSDACQGELHRAGAFPATDADPGYAPGDPLADMDALLRREVPVVPAPFDAAWSSDIAPIVRKFLAGDPDPAALWVQLSERIRTFVL
ncbi:MAG: hypothetical protein IJ646_07880, partial [Clostridia bacterium]|nr:hypothetical protein [Clostridia bacterium]